ncbi:hypothetical protein [Devosia faecipullorum]|uniref:hypothetical protein n=1 Tax=Devosia faecipullorum TaxID=2755039 RepID=UPI00187B74B3|nr:hypothetical protein [Devosia faecipullorum]MBE7733176.1 hypothetical protein [Devosia faecipullorum]
MSEAQVFGSHHVSRVLTEVGHRARLARLLPLSILTTAIGVAALGGAIIILGQNWSGAAWLIAGAVLLCIGALCVVAFSRHPRADILARRLDFSLGLSEQLSTATSAAARAPNSPIIRSLLAQAGRTAAGIDVVRAMPLGTKALSVSLAALMLATCGTAIAYSRLTDLPYDGVETVESAEMPDNPQITADALDVLAELVASDAQRRNSDYLKALSNSLEALAEAAREGASQAELETQLQALLDHAETGYGEQMPDWLMGGREEPAGQLQNAVAFSQARQQAAEERARMAEMRGSGPKISSADMYSLSDDRLARSASAQPNGDAPPGKNAISDREGELQNDMPAGGDAVARPMEDEAFASAGSLPVGAAAQSGKGESNRAGGGSQSLAEDTEFLKTMADPTQAMSISADEVSEGSRIRMHVPTSADLSEAGALAGDDAAGWSRQRAQLVTRHAIAPEASTVVSHYFNRPMPGQEP